MLSRKCELVKPDPGNLLYFLGNVTGDGSLSQIKNQMNIIQIIFLSISQQNITKILFNSNI